MSKSKINKLAKLLNRILLFGGLEHVAGEMIEPADQCSIASSTPTSTSTSWTMWVVMIFLVMIIAGSAGVSYKLWQKIKQINDELVEVKEAQRVDGMMIDAFEHEGKEEVAARKLVPEDPSWSSEGQWLC